MKKLVFLLISIVCISYSANAFAPLDSIGTSSRHGLVFIIHEVSAGETLYRISKAYSVSVEEIQKENTNTESLAVGQKLFIPTGKKAGSTASVVTTKTHKVQKGEGLYGISKKYSVTVKDIQKWNNLTSTNVNLGQSLIVSSPISNKPASQTPTATTELTHTVQAGEGLYSISKKYGVSVEEIKTLNNMTSTALNANQVLIIKKGNSPKNAPVVKEITTPTATTPSINHPKQLNPTTPIAANNRIEEKGIIGFAALAEYNSKYSYGLHKTAPIGTVVKIVTNEGLIHWVRIMGVLDTNETSVLKVNKTVLDKIGAGETAFEATISYVQ